MGEVCISDLGKTLNQSKDEGEMYPYLCAINVLWDKIDLSTLKQTRFRVEELEKYSVRKGDLLICEGGDIGRAAIWDKDETILYQNALHRVRFNDEILPRYCLLYLRHLKDNGTLDSRYGKGVTIKHLVKSSLLSIPIPFPRLSEQSRIVEELDQLSNIIEKKCQQLSELDNLAQSIFYDMFGDPVTNEKGWEVKKLSEEFEISSGGTPDTKNNMYWKNGSISWIGSNLCQNTAIYNNDGKYITELGYEKSSAKKFYPGFVLVALVGATIGKVGLLRFETTTNQNVAGINIPKNGSFTSEFVFYLLQHLYYMFEAVGGDKFKMANLKFIRSLPLLLPPLQLQQLFAQKIEAIEKEKELIKQSIKETEELFNSRMDYYFN